MAKEYKHYSLRLEMLEHELKQKNKELQLCREDHQIEQKLILILQIVFFVAMGMMFIMGVF